MPDEMEEIVADFITEAEESLDKIDPLFVELETKGFDKDMLHEIFRSMHTIKGAAGFLGFQSIVDVAHKSESILKRVREGEMSISTPLMDVILKSVDMLKLLLGHLKLKDGKEEDTSSLLKELDIALEGGAQSTEPAAQSPSTTQRGEKAETATEIPEPTIKDNVPTPDMHKQENAMQDKETVKTAAVKPASGDQTLRIDVDRVDKVMNLTGEIVLIRNRLLNIASSLDAKYSGDAHVENLLGTVAFLDLVTSDAQLAVMKMRMQPLKKVFGKFPRVVRDLSNNLGKDVELVITGEDTEVDRSVIEHIGDPMVHIIRNAIDHGIESNEERKNKNKSEKGKIGINAYQQGNQIIIEVFDNGKGIDVERVKRKAIEKRLITEDEAQKMSDESAINLIFLPGFSTSDVATELSGRGVGMDVVKTNISKLNGYVEVISKKDEGSTFRINIPLTLAILQALMVRANNAQYAVPLAPIEETLKIESKDISFIAGQKALVVRGKVCPLFELTEILGGLSPEHPESRYVLVISIGDKKFCIAVDELLGQEEIVIKTVEGANANSVYIVGATITGDGKVVLILDLAGVARGIFGLAKV